jgi:hypothetical protein
MSRKALLGLILAALSSIATLLPLAAEAQGTSAGSISGVVTDHRAASCLTFPSKSPALR